MIDFTTFSTYERQLHEAAGDPKRIETIIDTIRSSENPQLISAIEGLIREKELSQRIDAIWEERGFGTRMAKYKEPFKSLILSSKTSLKSKIELLFNLRKQSQTLDATKLKTNTSGEILDLVPQKLKNNETFDQTYKRMITGDSFRGKGIGPGEFFLALFGKNGDIIDGKGDVVLDGFYVEVKGSGGGSIKPGTENRHRVADQLRAEMAKLLKVDLDRSNKLHVHNTKSNFVTAMKKKSVKERTTILQDYLKKMYPVWKSNEIDAVAKDIANNIGTKDALKVIGQTILKKYQDKDKFDSIMFISSDGSKFSNVSDPTASSMLNVVEPKPPLFNRDGDTQALPDGYINIVIKK